MWVWCGMEKLIEINRIEVGQGPYIILREPEKSPKLGT